MDKYCIFNIIIIFFLFIGNIYIDSNHYFLIIYLLLLIYHNYIFYLFLIHKPKNKFKIIIFILLSILLFGLTYFIICDPNPLFYLFSYYIFFPGFFKAMLIVFFHTYFLSIYSYDKTYNLIDTVELSDKIKNNIKKNGNERPKFYFLSNLIKHSKRSKKTCFYALLIIILLFFVNIFLFLNRIKLWILFNNKEKTLPIASSRNTSFYITAMITDMENIIDNYIKQMKKLINYLGEQNVIISIIENGDSKDQTRKYLREFQQYLNKKKVLNHFLLKHEIDDPRKKIFPFKKYTPLRIQFYAKLRNRCFDFLYSLQNFDFNNTKIIYFNDIIFEYEDIINLLSTNNEEYDAVCAMDFFEGFSDRWVSIDLDGNSLMPFFPFFINKQAQDLIVNHKPIRVFSCWNGVIVFNAAPLKDRRIQFRYKNNNTVTKYSINNDQKVDYESECTYFHIDLFNLGYTKKLINPDVRVTYEYKYYFKRKYHYLSFNDIISYFKLYFNSLTIKRNKYMSNYKDKKIKFNSMVQNWYRERIKINKN